MRRVAIGPFVDRRAAREIDVDTRFPIGTHTRQAVFETFGVDAKLGGQLLRRFSFGKITVRQERPDTCTARPDHAQSICLQRPRTPTR